MRSTFRSLVLGLSTLLCAGAMAQYPYTIALSGTVANCYPGQLVTVQTAQGTQPILSFTIPVDSTNCSYSVFVPVSTQPAWVMVSTMCNGTVQYGSDSSQFNFIGDTAISVINFSCGGGFITDCLGVPNGPNMPGTPCESYPGSGVWGIYDATCFCDTLSANVYDCLQILNGPNMPGTPCNDNDPMTVNDVWSLQCVCTGNGGAIDCLGIPGGSNLPGTACVDSTGGSILTGTWSSNCVCQTNSTIDCLGIVGGPNMPGTPCNDGDSLTTQDTWTPNCDCIGVTFGYYDCLGQLNGPALPGTPCNDNNPATLNDTWDANCGCVGGGTTLCNADFWVLQGFTVDSMNTPTPIPYELWVWNLTSGGSGTYTSLWSFGDGTSSTDPFPTHTYSGNGPYLLCLTINDGAGCTSTHCDTVSIDANGLYTGMIGGGTDRQNGFTLNVQNALTAGVSDVQVAGNIALWPNPVADDINIALTDAIAGTVDVTVIDLSGRVVVAERRALSTGRNQLTVPTNKLSPGLYTVRIGNGATSISQRFVKVN
jgi:hypothetical protein